MRFSIIARKISFNVYRMLVLLAIVYFIGLGIRIHLYLPVSKLIFVESQKTH